MRTKLRQITYNIVRFLPFAIAVSVIVLSTFLMFWVPSRRSETASAASASDFSILLPKGSFFYATSNLSSVSISVPSVPSVASTPLFVPASSSLGGSATNDFRPFVGCTSSSGSSSSLFSFTSFVFSFSSFEPVVISSCSISSAYSPGFPEGDSASELPSIEDPLSRFVFFYVSEDCYVGSIGFELLKACFPNYVLLDSSSSGDYDDGYRVGYQDGLNKGQTDSFANPISTALAPVQTFLTTPFFGTNFTFGSVLSVVLFVAVAIIFLKLFAGG